MANGRERVLAAFFNTLEPMLDTFAARGFDPLRKRYLSSWLHTNQRVHALENHPQGGRQRARRAPGT